MRKILQFSFILSLMLLLLPTAVKAQERTVTGTIVSDDNKTPLSGVTVHVKGTRKITKTDADGKFSIKVNPGETLIITYVGYQTMEVKPGEGNVGVSLKIADNTMGTVVVTAMDTRRSPRSLGYSTQGVAGKDIAATQRENFLNSLQGRVAGLTVTPTTGEAGASSTIVLRGYNSLTGNNQPLFIVDGIILDNQTINETSNGGTALGLASDRPNRNNDYQNRIADINPNDIESVNVLKGPEATALYGSQASAGAIVITTKKADVKKISISYDNSFRVQKLTRFNDLNNDYSPGSSGIPNYGIAAFQTGSGTYYGPKYPANTTRYDNINNFFKTGFSQTHNLNAEAGFKNAGFRASGSYFNQNGVVPDNTFKRYNFRITNTTKVNKWITLTPSFQYVFSENDKPIRSAGGYLLDLYAWPNTNDIRNYADPTGNKIPIFATDPYTELDNPFFNVKRNRSHDETKRSIFSGGIDLTPFKWLSVSGRFGYDTYKMTGYTFYHPLSNLSSRAQLGALDNYWRNYYGYNHTITATFKKDYKKFSARLMLGTMWQDYETQMFAIYGTNLVDSAGTTGLLYMTIDRKTGLRLPAPVLVNETNFSQVVGSLSDSSITLPSTRVRLAQNNYGHYNRAISRQVAYFGDFSLSWNNVLFFDYTHRFESASVFPKDFRNYNYPGFSFSGIISDIFPKLKTKFLSYWKVRASRASTARQPDPYKNQSVFVQNFTSSNVGTIYSYGFDNNNPLLRPEKQHTYELGTEFRFLNSRIGIDFSYYNTLCLDQIQNQFRASYATGFILNTQNAASSRNQGVEAIIDLNPIHKKNLNWNVKFNYNHTWARVLTLPTAIAYEAYIADTWLYGNARGGMIRGMPVTTITGFHYQRNIYGQILINPSTGLPVIEQTFTVIGNRMPRFTLGTLNNIQYKNWNLNFLWDLKMGGDVFDGTDYYLTLQGKSQRTADREKPRVIQGVLNDGLQNSATPTPNTIVIVPYFQTSYYTSMPEEEFIEHNVSWMRLRDITLSYTLPDKFVKGTKVFKALGVFVTGNDLVLWTNYRGADPSTNGTTAAENGVGGVGFDYGNLPTPKSINFGIRATFK